MSCSAPDQSGVQLGSGTTTGADAVDAAPGPTVIEGRVLRAGAPAPGAYVRLLDGGGEFTAEVVAGALGQFRFFAAPGQWTVRALATGARAARTVEAGAGRVEVELSLSAVPENTG